METQKKRCQQKLLLQIGIFIAPQADLALDKNVKLTIKPEFYLSDFF